MALKSPKHYRITLVLLLSAKLLLFFSFSACSPDPHPQQAFLHEIDSLQKQLMSDSVAFQELLRRPHENTISQMITLLSQTSKKDPFFESRSSKLVSGLLYFEQLKSDSAAFIEEISYTAEQLRNLYYDIDQQILNKLNIRQYLTTETEAVKRISAKNQYFLNSLEANLLLIETLDTTHQTEKSVLN